MIFGIPTMDFFICIVMGVPASIGMTYAALTVGREKS